jgi:preprotein translocase subunit SecD
VDRKDGFYTTVDYSQSTDDEAIKLERSPSITSMDISEITKGSNLGDNSPEISIVLTSEGARKFRQLTYDNIGKPIAIVIDGKIVSLPIVQAEIYGGKVSLRIDSSEEELDSMIERLRGLK